MPNGSIYVNAVSYTAPRAAARVSTEDPASGDNDEDEDDSDDVAIDKAMI